MGTVIRPIQPKDVLDKKMAFIPDDMIQALNELIAKNWNGNSAKVTREELLLRYFKLSTV